MQRCIGLVRNHWQRDRTSIVGKGRIVTGRRVFEVTKARHTGSTGHVLILWPGNTEMDVMFSHNLVGMKSVLHLVVHV